MWRCLDEGSWSGYQKLLVLGAALAIVLDGIRRHRDPANSKGGLRMWPTGIMKEEQ